MAGRPVKRLFDLEIDEISLVDRSANQHADVAIAKRDEGTMTLMDVDGYEVAEDQLQPGDVVYDAETGEELVACEEGAEPEDYFEAEGEEEVGKAAATRIGVTVSRGRRAASAGVKGKQAGRNLVDDMSAARTHASFGWGRGLGNHQGDESASRSFRAANHVARNRGRYGLGAGVAGGAYVAKSLGEEVYEELSKALTTDARDEVISKAMEQARHEADEARAEAAQAWEIAKSLQDRAELDEYYEVAKGYGLPGDPADIAVILKSAADTMPAEHLEYLDRLFSSAGEQLYAEHGSALGMQESSVMSQIEAMASQAVAKADVSEAQAIVELYAANDEAYDAYLAETR